MLAAGEMRLLSRVFKSFSVDIHSPRIIEHDKVAFSSKSHSDDIDVTGESETTSLDVEHLRNQAKEILQETEQMVKELIETARLEAEKIIGSANEEAGKIIDEGRNRLKQIEEDAFKKGQANGYQDAKNKFEDDYRAKVLEAKELVENAIEERDQIIAGSEEEIVQLAIAVARKIIGQDLTVNPDSIVDIVKRAIQKATDREELTVRVNPDNLDDTLNGKDKITQAVKGVRKLKILADKAIAAGGCVVESSNGTVDARVERQLKEIEQALMEVSPNAQI